MPSSVSEAVAGFVAGRVKAERLVIAVTTAYYGRDGQGTSDGLRPLIDIIDRAAPGIVELGTDGSEPGFGIRLAERPFPKQYEAELRRAAQAYLARHGGEDVQQAGLSHRTAGFARLFATIRRLFTASA
jgi:hypothetical protein